MAYKTEWDLSVFYKDVDDPAIERDQKIADRAITTFAKKYRKDKKHLKSPKALVAALADYEKLILLPSSKAGHYVFYRKDLNVEDKRAEALAAKLDERGTKRGNQILFFPLELGKIPATLQTRFLKDASLAPYRYWLKQLFESAKYDLTEPEEKILSLLGDVAHGRWVQATENVLNKKTVALGADQIPLPQAQGILSQQSAEKRHALQKELNAAYEATADIAESEINAVFTDKKIEDELRGYKTPYEATVRGYQNDTKTVLALVDAVTKHFSIAHRFYEVKRKLLKLDRLTYEDRSASVGDIKSKIPFERATALVREEFEKLDPHYAQIFDRLLDNSQVDVYPRKGKTGIQYCSASVSLPTMLMLNYTGDFNSVKTLAHEMGHAMHAERAKDQRPMYQGHPTSTAETASTFFERVALKRLVADLPSEERIVALHNALQDDISTVFRQIACFRFEQDLHAEIRRDGYVPKDRIAELMNEHMKAYLGPAFDLKKEDGYFFVAWSHIRTFFYVYSYAYGHLISMALYAKLAKDPSFIKKVDGFLSAGESKSPYDIFKSCGLDTRNPAIFVEGLKAIERDVAELERLIK